MRLVWYIEYIYIYIYIYIEPSVSYNRFQSVYTAVVIRLDLNFGISGCALQWLSSHLSDRSQFVSVGGRRSKTTVCEFAVPQGFVLGPLLHVLAVRVTDRQRHFRFRYQSFTVCWWHSALYFTERWESSLSLLSDCFVAVHWWFTLNGLSLNPDKSEAIIIGTGARQRIEVPSKWLISAGNVHIQPSESVRSLGIVIDNTLSFDAHVNSVCKAVNHHDKALRHIRKMLTTNVALTISSTMVGARMNYRNHSEHNGRRSNELSQRHSSRNE